MKERICGIDFSSEKLDYSLGGSKPLTGQVAYSEKGLQVLVELLEQADIELVVMEATGGYEQRVAHFMYARGLQIAIVNPQRVRRLADASGKAAKTDGIDANIIRRFGEIMSPRLWEPPAANLAELRSLVRRRAQLISDRARERTRRKQASETARSSIDHMMKYLSEEIRRIEAKIQSVLKSSETLFAKAKRFRTIPGVGPVTAAVLITEAAELGKIGSKEASALAGTAPYANESGNFRGKRSTRGGRPRLRGALYMAVLSGVRFNAVMKAFYESLIARGKEKKVAMVACMNKLIRWLNAMERKQLNWSQMDVVQKVV